MTASTPRIAVYPADLGGCGAYRCIWAAEALAGSGAPIDLILPTAPDDRQIQALWHEAGDGTRTLLDVAEVEADIVVLQRPLTDTLAYAIGVLQRRGIRVVVEIDDDFEGISARNVSWAHVDPKRNPKRNRAHLRWACEQADLVVCTTPALAARYGRHGRVAIVPNFVPTWYLGLERDDHDEVVVGWSGSVETHPDDLQVCGGGVARAVNATGALMAVVGTGVGVTKRLGLSKPPVTCGWVPLGEYPRALSQFDVGIVPLELTPFNQAKSALKMMEMAAVGVVPVVSPTDDNLRMAQEGIGFVASKPRSWEGMVKALVGNPLMRAEMAAQGREVMRRFTIEGNVDRWWDAWSLTTKTPAVV